MDKNQPFFLERQWNLLPASFATICEMAFAMKQNEIEEKQVPLVAYRVFDTNWISENRVLIWWKYAW